MTGLSEIQCHILRNGNSTFWLLVYTREVLLVFLRCKHCDTVCKHTHKYIPPISPTHTQRGRREKGRRRERERKREER